MAKYYLYPDGTDATGGSISVFGGSNPWEVTDKPRALPDDSSYVYTGATGPGAGGVFSVTMAAMANAISINYIKLWARCQREIGSGGTDAFIEPFIIVNGTQYSDRAAFNPNNAWNLELCGTWETNPDNTLPWVKSDLDAIKTRFDLYDLSVPFRAPNISQIFIEVDYVAAPAQLDQARIFGSQLLRLFREPVKTFKISGLPLRFADIQVGDDFDVTSFMDPHYSSGRGAGDKVWERKMHRVTSSDLDLDSLTVSLTLMSIRRYLVNLWDSGATDLNPGGIDDGIARLDLGAGRVYTRASSAWGPVPSDGRILAQADNNPLYERGIGIRLESARTNIMRNSFFADGVSTSWTPTGTGTNGSAITDDTAVTLCDPTVSINTAKILTGSPNTVDTYLQQARSAANSAYVMSFDYKLGTATAVKWQLTRGVDGFYYNAGTDSYQAGAVWNSSASPDFQDTMLDNGFTRVGWRIAAPGATPGAWTLRIGLESTDGDSKDCWVGHVQMEVGDSMSSRIHATVAGSVTRQYDVLTYGDEVGKRTWPYEQGTVSFDFTPFWSTGLTAQKNLIRGQYDSSAAFGDLVFVTTAGVLTFRRRIDSVNYDLTASPTWVYGQTYKIAIRITGASEELGATNRTVDVFVDGVQVATGVTAGYNSLSAISAGVYLGTTSAGVSADGAFKNIQISPWVLTDEEIANL